MASGKTFKRNSHEKRKSTLDNYHHLHNFALSHPWIFGPSCLQNATAAVMCLLPGPLSLHALAFPGTGPSRGGPRRDQVSSDQIFYPLLRSPMKLGWLCRGAYGNLGTAFRVHASICVHSSQMVCARGFIPHTMLSVTLGCSLSYLLSQHDLHSPPPPYTPNNAYFCMRKISLLSYRPQHLPNCFHLQLLAGY